MKYRGIELIIRYSYKFLSYGIQEKFYPASRFGSLSIIEKAFSDGLGNLSAIDVSAAESLGRSDAGGSRFDRS